MPHTGKVTNYTENSGNGLAKAHVEISDDADPTNVIATITVYDTIANIDQRIRDDIVPAVKQIREETTMTPAKDTYAVSDTDVVT